MSPLSSGGTRQEQAKDPAKRLHRFEKEYGNLLVSRLSPCNVSQCSPRQKSTWRTSSNLSRDSDAAETLEIRLQDLTNILSDESRRPLPHPCIQFASLRQIYVPIGKIATTSYNEWIIKEAVLLFATLIESEEEAFVENHTFSASLTNLLVRITGANSVRLGLDTESRVVELAFNITTKIRLDPDILPAWFKTQKDDQGDVGSRRNSRTNRDSFAGRTQRADFPLFYILMDYIHHEGKVGDFARTGLLYIIEAASNSAVLEQWIVESDLSTLMATGLGALYSQLSRKLVIDHHPHNLPPTLAFSDYQHPTSNTEVISSCSPEFQSHLETFLSHLLFWQDVLNHCKSLEVKSTLLEHFQVIFLEQLLYPSLLESSDIDGGSSVAVLTYLRRILESLDHPDMINLILHYLLALPDSRETQDAKPRSSVSDARKRKSMDLATLMASKSDLTATPLLFNLVDLILACLRSRNQQTIHVTLRLVSAILKRHHRYAVMTLLKTEILPNHTVHRTIGAHEQEVEYFMSLAGQVGGQDNFDEVYENILQDTTARVESHPCSLKLVAPAVGRNHGQKSATVTDSLPGAPREVREHTLRPDDPLLNAMLDLLQTFFLNSVETNLSVTETLLDLGVCGYMSIEGWLTRSPSTYDYDDDDEIVAEGKHSQEDASSDQERREPTSPVGKASTEQVESRDKDASETTPAKGDVGKSAEAQDGLEDNDGKNKEAADDGKESEERRGGGDEPKQTAETAEEGSAENTTRPVDEESESSDKEEERQKKKDMHECRRRPRWSQQSVPRFLDVIKQVCDQVSNYKETIPRFEELLQQRREAFYTADMILQNPLPTRREGPGRLGTPDARSDSLSRSASPTRPSAFEGFAQRLLSELGTPNRSRSPRGRKELGRSGGSGSVTPSHKIDNYALATPKSISIAPPKDPFSYHEPSKGYFPRAVSPSRIGDDIGVHLDDDGSLESRMADFAAADQTVLSRRVGLPGGKIAPIPLNFDKPSMPQSRETSHDDEDEEDDEDQANKVAIGPDADEMDDDEGSKDEEAEEDDESSEADDPEMVSVSHVITNVMIFQSFVFELASLVQVRAGLFNEVRFV